MKLLIFGIDGGDLEICKTFKMPFLKRFIKENISFKLTEDLFSRGWAEMLTGEHGSETGGFYMAPILDGSHKFSTKFSMNQTKDIENIVPLWDLWEKRKVHFTIMNVPTSTPVPKTKNGIVIGSGGGGLNKVEGLPENMVSDNETRDFLIKKGYVADIRIPNSEFDTPAELVSSLNHMETLRTESFIELCLNNSSEYGFLANRGTTIVEYLCRSEIEFYAKASNEQKASSATFKMLEDHFLKLDGLIESLYNQLKPEHFMISSDHGIVAHKKVGSVTPLLERYGYLKKKSTASITNQLKGLAKSMGLLKSRKIVSKMKSISKDKDAYSDINWKRTMAFGNEYVSGIYINDTKRFGGPVSEKDLPKLVDEICDNINSCEEFNSVGLKGKPYRRDFSNTRFEQNLPDILFTGQQGIYFDNVSSSVFRDNPNYNHIPADLSKVKSNPFTGEKGKHPLFALTKSTNQFVEKEDKKDLTLVYKLAKRI